MTCEDYPCCGHEAGCCPDFDANGRQINMRCVCGAVVPLDSPYSLCAYCLSQGYDDGEDPYRFDGVDAPDFDIYESYENEDFGDWGEAGLWG